MRLLAPGFVLLASLTGCGSASGGEQPPPGLFEGRSGPLLKRFSSDQVFRRYVERARKKIERPTVLFDAAESPPPPMLSVDAPSEAASDAATPANPEITNNQTVGVDEGGIVKQIGRFLVILQDGRLFSIDTGEGVGAPLRLADRINVYRSPETAAAWYDEMLVLGDRILVTAYRYDEGASEITVLRMSPDGRMTREGRYLLSSNDYYSTENYATRLVGDSLVFYAPITLATFPREGGAGALSGLPRLRRADGDGPADEGEPLIRPTEIYAPPGEIDWPILHTIAICPLRQSLDCRTTAFVGPHMREFYVSPTDAFLWIGAPDGLPWSIDYGNARRSACTPKHAWEEEGGDNALLYRLPLGGGAVGAVHINGVPTDQFAFDSRDERFRALLRRNPECGVRDTTTDLALLDIPLSAFGPRLRNVANAAYAALPPFEGGQLENRFVGNWLVYGGRPHDPRAIVAPGSERAAGSALVAVPLGRPAAARTLALPHNVLRIERAGRDALVTGYGLADGLSLSYVRLGGGGPQRASGTILPGRYESENRSHAFNAWIKAEGDGVVGLPTSRSVWRSGRGWSDSESSDLSFVTIGQDKSLSGAGELSTQGTRAAATYACEVSCIDWYGNSRPIFTGGRIFALMGTEIVEGRIERGRVAALTRLDLTQGTAHVLQARR
jgi:hypothetical protein